MKQNQRYYNIEHQQSKKKFFFKNRQISVKNDQLKKQKDTNAIMNVKGDVSRNEVEIKEIHYKNIISNSRLANLKA